MRAVATLIGIISDGFLLYGRQCPSTGDHIDDSGEHTALTPHRGLRRRHE